MMHAFAGYERQSADGGGPHDLTMCGLKYPIYSYDHVSMSIENVTCEQCLGIVTMNLVKDHGISRWDLPPIKKEDDE